MAHFGSTETTISGNHLNLPNLMASSPNKLTNSERSKERPTQTRARSLRVPVVESLQMEQEWVGPKQGTAEVVCFFRFVWGGGAGQKGC